MKDFKEKWVPWYPVGEESDHYEKISFLDCNETGIVLTCVNLQNKKQLMKMFFNGAFVSYRMTDETYMCTVQSESSVKASFAYKVNNSNYISWISETSKTVSDAMVPDLQHFVFVSSDDYLETLTDQDPDIELITRE